MKEETEHKDKEDDAMYVRSHVKQECWNAKDAM